jgi:hypothetical protein
MIKVKHLIVGLFLLISLSLSAQTEWTKYDYSSYDFKIEFPQAPSFSIDSSSFNNEPLNTYFWEVNVSDSLHPNTYYSASLTKYPSDFIHSDSLFAVVEGFINSTQSSIIDDDSYTYLSASLVAKDGFPGKVFKWKNNSNDVFFEFHVFLIENNLFQLSLVTKSGENHNTSINRYFESFEIANISPGNFKLPELSEKRTLTIHFPEKPAEQTKTVDSEYGKLLLDIQMLEPKSEDKNMVYIAMETKYSSSVVDVDNTYELNTFYKKSIDGSLNSVNGDLISINDIYFKEHLGKEFRCYFSGGEALMVYRVFYINDRLYSVGVITTPDNDKNKKMTNFLDSFKISK